MVGVKQVLFILISLCSLNGNAAELEYISPDKQKELESLFNQAQFTPAKDATTIQSAKWTCDMYGMRTRMQVQRSLKLYKWTSTDEGLWKNEGAQLVSDYKNENSALVGRRDRFEDQVKITKDGELVSRLSLVSPAGTVLAYSVCKTL